jgi:Predicted transcriptional regulator
MARPKKDNERNRPSDGELRILNVLWKRGPSTVREVFELIGEKNGVGYTTVLKILQVMHEKGIVSRDESERTHVYAAILTRDDVQEQVVDELLGTVFDGSKKRLVMRILSQTKASPDELAEIRKVIAQLETEDNHD